MFGADTCLYASQDFLTRRDEFLQILEFTEVGGRLVLAKKAFHKGILYQKGMSEGLIVSSSAGCSTGVSSTEGA